jgi:hypothetical protein
MPKNPKSVQFTARLKTHAHRLARHSRQEAGKSILFMSASISVFCGQSGFSRAVPFGLSSNRLVSGLSHYVAVSSSDVWKSFHR